MKSFLFTALTLIFLSINFSACWINEVGPSIDTTSTGGATFQVHRVLLEGITGIRCSNCPSGHDLAETISSGSSGRVEVVDLYSGTIPALSTPYPINNFNFSADFPEGTQIDNWLGPSTSWPCADIDRKIFSGESALFLSSTKWAGYVAQELAIDTPTVAITINKNYNSGNRTLNVSLGLHYNNTETTPNYFTIYLVEDSIIDPQSNDTPAPVHIDTFYNHMNVVRHVLTSYNGNAVSGNTVSGNDLTTPSYSFILPSNINPDHARVVAFVSEYGSSKEVLQVVSKQVK